MRVPRGKEDHIKPCSWKPCLPGSFSQNSLAPVPKDRISQSFRRNEGDSCWAAFVES
jgi:hypothetical protein